jgi:hypothetical protein
MTSIEIMKKAFNEMATLAVNKFLLERGLCLDDVIYGNDGDFSFCVQSKCHEFGVFSDTSFWSEYDIADFLHEITRDGLITDNLKSYTSSDFRINCIDLVLNSSYEIYIDYDISEDNAILLSKDIECLCFMTINNDVAEAIDLYGGERVLPVLAAGL